MKKIILSSILIALSSHASAYKELPRTSPPIAIELPKILNPNIQQDTNINNNSVFNRTGPTIQIAILLDTSNSMDGLISQTKSQIWKIINEVSKANKHNKNILMQVSLFEYGNDNNSKHEGFIKMLSPLGSDLDALSEQLFALKTRGGQEYAGQVIQESVNRLQWSEHPDDLRLVIIAGNENFEQGSVPFRHSIQKANDNKIIVNTIFCGNYNQGVNLQWKRAADLGNGKYMNIQQNDDIVYVQSPYDNEINSLNVQINNTYIGYGSQGIKKKRRQLEQDTFSSGVSSVVMVERTAAKASSQYKNDSWDIVSLYEEDKEAAEEMISKGNINGFEAKDKTETAKLVKEKVEERNNIKKQINELQKKREIFLVEERKKNINKKSDIGSVLIKNMREILIDNDFSFDK